MVDHCTALVVVDCYTGLVADCCVGLVVAGCAGLVPEGSRTPHERVHLQSVFLPWQPDSCLIYVTYLQWIRHNGAIHLLFLCLPL